MGDEQKSLAWVFCFFRTAANTNSEKKMNDPGKGLLVVSVVYNIIQVRFLRFFSFNLQI